MAPASPDRPRPSLLVHYGELGLKAGNRSRFEARLRTRIQEGMEKAGVAARTRLARGRLEVSLAPEAAEEDLALALDAAARIPGVVNVGIVRLVPSDLASMGEAAAEALAAAPPGSFKVESRRADKSYPLNSIEVSQAVAPYCLRRTGRTVDVHRPDVVVTVEITHEGAYVGATRAQGPGGLPVGTTRRLLAFLSGGIDSAVAAWLMVRRGARVTAVHFHNRTHEGSAVLDKLEDICRVLARSAGTLRLLVVPFEACQRAIVAAVPARHRMLVYRRAMFRIGDPLARRERALGYVTGDSLGQVASQTAENLRTIHAVATLPVYMPLCGSDKTEIVAWARRIGTYDISVRPHADCCSFLIAPHPATKSTPDELDALEAPLDWPALVEEAVARTEPLAGP